MNCMTVRCCGEGSVSLRDLVYFSICLSIVHTGWVEGGKWRLPAGRGSSVVTLRGLCYHIRWVFILHVLDTI